MTISNQSYISIFWPKIHPLKVTELQYSYEFCRNVSKKFCLKGLEDCQWIDYSPKQSMKELLDQADYDYTVFVTEPQTLLTSCAVKKLFQITQKGYHICAPILSQTDYHEQQASLPAPYVNLNTYLEIVYLLSNNTNFCQVDVLDPACVMYNSNWLRSEQLQNQLDLIPQDFVNSNSSGAIVVHGSFIHRFGDYYNSQRDDLIDQIPEWAFNILDVGCAFGGYGKRLKEIRSDIWLAGVELNPIMAEYASHYYDQIYSQPVEELSFEKSFDLINCGDVLEHLQDPWTMLKRFYEILTPGGYLVTSVPNIGHWSIVHDLLQGRFEYIPVGLLCITHIRWFTELSLRESLQDAGFKIKVFERQQFKPTPHGEQFITDMLDKGYADENSLRTNEFLVVGVKN